MKSPRELSPEQIDRAVAAAVENSLPVTVTARLAGRWVGIGSRILAFRGGRLVLELPTTFGVLNAQQGFVPGDKVNISYKLNHSKHLLVAEVAGSEQFALEDGSRIRVLSVLRPTSGQQLPRRSQRRVSILTGRMVRASFWMGGAENEPPHDSGDTPVWAGRVTDMSDGGCQVLCDAEAARHLEVGDIVGIRVSLEKSEESVCTDARVRHAGIDGQKARMGFRFTGLSRASQRRCAIKLIRRSLGRALGSWSNLIASALHETTGACKR